MKKQTLFPLLATAILAACGTDNGPAGRASQQAAATAPAYDSSLVLPPGFKAILVADSLGAGARHIAVDAEGDLYVQMSGLADGKGLAALRDTSGDGRADQFAYFGNHAGTGMEVAGNFLYCSSDEAVFRYDLQPGQLAPDESTRVLLVGGFPQQNEHASKSFTLDNGGNIYVNVGAPANACQVENRVAGSRGQDPCPLLKLQAGIWKFPADKLAQVHGKDGERFGTGIRNAIALDWNDQAGSLFALQHGRDQLNEFWPELFSAEQNAELPAEEFLQVNKGDDFGWPYCYYDQFQKLKVLAPEYGGDGKKTGRCTKCKDPLVGFPGHMAPNDLVFYNGNTFPEKYRNGAFVAFHGSWNRSPLEQKGFFVVFVPFKDGQVSGEWEAFADGFAGVKPVPSPSDARHRPTGLAVGGDGSLYVADSVKGKIWKIVYQGS